jgi:predicted dehydrogenase
MSTSVRDTAAPPLRLALIADGLDVDLFAGILNRSPHVQLVAQSGMKQGDAAADVPWFDDSRVMLTRGGVEAVALCVSPRSALELAETAAELGVHVWRLPPLGRTFAEAAELAAKIRNWKIVYRVASWWEHIAEEARAVLARIPGFKPHFSELRASAPGPPVQSWRSAQTDAGGGVLVTAAYPLLEALFAIRGLPVNVAAAIGRYRRRSGEPPRETEDSAAAVLRYESGPAVLRATWDIPPYESISKHDGPDATIVISTDKIGIGTDTLEEAPLAPDFLIADLERFVRAVRLAAAEPSVVSLERHVAVNALLDSLYLSARTNQPESPGKLYEVQGWTLPRV